MQSLEKTSRLLDHERKKKEAESRGGGPLGLKAKYVEILSFLNIDFPSPRVVSTWHDGLEKRDVEFNV